jgi:phosphatidylinositol alpha-1,6-mannosyltransferase
MGILSSLLDWRERPPHARALGTAEDSSLAQVSTLRAHPSAEENIRNVDFAGVQLVLVHIDDSGTGGIQRFARDLNAATARVGCAHRVLRLGTAPGGAAVARLRLIGQLAWQLRRSRSVVVFTHIHLAPLGMLVRLMRGRYVVVLHGRECWRPPKTLTKAALLRARRLWVVSDYTRSQVIAHTPELDEHSFSIVPLIVSDRFLRTTGTSGYDARRVVTIGRLQRSESYKGVDQLLAAWPRVLEALPDASLTVIGSGDAEQELRRVAAGIAGATIQFLGRASDEELARTLERSTLFCLPGRLERDASGLPLGEGFGIVFLEASAVALPVIAGNAGGSPEAVEEGVTGLVVNGESASDIASAIVRLLSDPTAAQRMGAAGRERVIGTRTSAALESFVADQVERF